VNKKNGKNKQKQKQKLKSRKKLKLTPLTPSYPHGVPLFSWRSPTLIMFRHAHAVFSCLIAPRVPGTVDSKTTVVYC
jgi:hypothetical protein